MNGMSVLQFLVYVKNNCLRTLLISLLDNLYFAILVVRICGGLVMSNTEGSQCLCEDVFEHATNITLRHLIYSIDALQIKKKLGDLFCVKISISRDIT